MNNMSYFPEKTAVSIRLEKLIKTDGKRLLSERMSSRMVKCASALEVGEHIGWQMAVPTKGRVSVSLFGTGGLCMSDLEWFAKQTGKVSKGSRTSKFVESLEELYEVYLPVAESISEGTALGFGGSTGSTVNGFAKWPTYYSAQFEEIVSVLKKIGGFLRVVVGSASEKEQSACQKNTLRTYDVDGIASKDYIGRPIKIRVLLLLPCAAPIRLITVFEEAVQGAKLRYLGKMKEPETAAEWNAPIANAAVLPDYAARILMMEPELHSTAIGIEVCEKEIKKLPASHKNAKDKKAVGIGRAIDTAGVNRKITIGEMDLKRHYQIVGQTGTGKSTLLSTIILSAIERGHGLTFFDPHGSTIDVILRSLPEKYANRVRVVHIGDTENPVPFNIWDSDDPTKEERNINDLCELFGDIFNPPGEVFVGPRYERWLSTFAKASIAFLGKRASLESIAVISQSQDNMLKVSKAIIGKYPELVETIKQEYGTDRSNDFQNMLNWYLCKFQRLTSIEQLRKTLGAGANALDFQHTIDTDTVTLIDLASPTIGTHAARIIGTLMLMKLWNGAMLRKERDRTHLVIVDEASLFQTNPMPRMLAESRKFGISMILCHQHTGQLSQEIRDALEANSANLSAFRLSPRDAALAAIRFNNPTMQVSLARLDAFNAITTISVNGIQTAPFTLEIIRPKMQKNGEEIAEKIEVQSIEKLVKPYRELRALTSTEILDLLNRSEVLPKDSEVLPKNPAWLDEWTKRRNEHKQAV